MLGAAHTEAALSAKLSMAIHRKVKHRTKEKAFPTTELRRNRNPHKSWCREAAYSCLVFDAEDRGKVWVFLKHKLLHAQIDSLAVSWKKIPASLSMENPS